MYILPFVLPLFAILFNTLFGSYLSRLYVGFMSSISVAVAAVASIFIFWEVAVCGVNTYISLFEWCDILDFKVNFIFGIDTLASTMIFTICFISFCVHLFSIDYMFYDPSFKRFIIYLTLFTLFMLIMVSASNLIQFFLGWEGIGVMSYLLINFWYDRPEANRSANKAIFLNKIGDLGLYFLTALCFMFYHSIDFSRISEWGLDSNNFVIKLSFLNFYLSSCDILSIFIIIAAVGKSAQIGLHAWLPDAMEGPTPVSALLHSATMVTAGVFLIIRSAPILERSTFANSFLLWLGILTALMSGFIACNQNDFKKIIAYSTTGQLSLMFIACGSSQYCLALQHLFNHAFFKAGLFLIAGSLIHLVNSKQDIRDYGHVLSFMPITFTCFIISSLSLLGIPGTSGSISKEAILESTFFSPNSNDLISILTLLSVCLTSFYSIQLLWFVFYKNINFVPLKLYEEKSFIFCAIIIITVCGSISGLLFQEIFMNLYTFRDVAAISGNYFFLLESSPDFTWLLISELPTIVVISSGLFSVYFHSIIERRFLLPTAQLPIYIGSFFNRKFFFDFFVFYFIGFLLMLMCYNFFWKSVDRFLFEVFGPSGFVTIFVENLYTLNLYQNALVYIYNRFIILALLASGSIFFLTDTQGGCWFNNLFIAGECNNLFPVVASIFLIFILVKFEPEWKKSC